MEKKNTGREFSEEDVRKMTREEFLSLSKEEKMAFRRVHSKMFVEEHKFTPEKRKELINKLEEFCACMNKAKDLLDDIRILMPSDKSDDPIESAYTNGLVAANFNAAHIRLDSVYLIGREYLGKLLEEEKENDGSSG